MDKKKKYFLISATGLIFSVVLFSAYFSLTRRPVAEVSLAGHQVIKAELAVNNQETARGLMFRKSLAADEGMLFVFPDEDKRFFWMKNTLIPLDLFFISADFVIVDIKKNFEPCKVDTCPTHKSAAPARYVLETNAGMADKQELKVGDKISIKLK